MIRELESQHTLLGIGISLFAIRVKLLVVIIASRTCMWYYTLLETMHATVC